MGGGIASRPCTPGIAAVIILAAFSVSVPGIGVSQLAWELFLAAAAFEFVRQFMRWSHAGYMSEHMPSDLRATAIGMTLMFLGLAGTTSAWIVQTWWNLDASDFKSAGPFLAAAVLGLVGAVGLLIYNREFPIRTSESPNDTGHQPLSRWGYADSVKIADLQQQVVPDVMSDAGA